MSVSELLPCPFCGAVPTMADIRADLNQGTKWGGVICPDCGVAGPEVRTGYDPVECWADDAIEAWNRRTPPAQAAEAVERVAEALWVSCSTKHKLLEKAGYAIDWASQPNIIKRDYHKQARAAIAAMQAGEG